ncbi:MAG: branched-chain amino acid ABC transporter permease [Dehalococcoidia bacterium]
MTRQLTPRAWALPASTIVGAGLFGLLVTNFASEAFEGLLVTAGIFAILTISWNLMGGIAGIFSLGHAAFFGVGAYAAAIIQSNTGFPFWISLLFGGVAAAVLTIVFLPAFRASGLFLAILTLAFAEALGIAAGDLFPGGRNGLFVDPLFARGSHGWFWTTLAVATAAIVITWAVRRSNFGLGLQALGSDRVAAASLGMDARVAEAQVTLISGFLAGLAGAIYALSQTFVDPGTVFNVEWSILPLLMAVLGGLGSTFGPLVGAVGIFAIDEYVRKLSPSAGGYSAILQGLLLVTLALRFQNGLAGAAARFLRPVGARSTARRASGGEIPSAGEGQLGDKVSS